MNKPGYNSAKASVERGAWESEPSSGMVPRWWMSYAALMTLLACVFLVLYSSKTQSLKSNSDAQAQKNSAEAMQTKSGVNPEQSESSISSPLRSESEARRVAQEQLLVQFQSQFKDGGRSREIMKSPDGVVVRIQPPSLFSEGRSEPEKDTLPILTQVASWIVALPYSIRIEGFASRGEKVSPRFSSLWELSAARAATVARIFIEQGNLPANRVEVSGWADQRPLDPEASVESQSAWLKAKERRIEIQIKIPETESRKN